MDPARKLIGIIARPSRSELAPVPLAIVNSSGLCLLVMSTIELPFAIDGLVDEEVKRFALAKTTTRSIRRTNHARWWFPYIMWAINDFD